MRAGAASSPGVATLGATGFACLAAADLGEQLGGVSASWSTFAASWDDLPLDEYMADGGRYRRRRHACFRMAGQHIEREPHQAHFQSRDYNSLNGGIERWFAPVDPEIGGCPLLTHLLRRFGATFAAAIGLAQSDARWFVEMHQFRIEARPDVVGLPTPEGMHRDGVDWVAVTLVRRENVAGGVTSMADASGCPLGAFTLGSPLDTVLLDDHRVWHGVTPLAPLDPAKPAFRDVLVLTYRDRRMAEGIGGCPGPSGAQ